MEKTVLVDCDQGRRLGCASFCCRLIVRLGPHEKDPGRPDCGKKSCVDKDLEDGLCVYFDRSSGRCAVWEDRPEICRTYDCNRDPLLQIVLCQGFHSLRQLVTAPAPGRGSPTGRVPYIAARAWEGKGAG